MNTGQSLLTIGAMLILSVTVLRVNNNILSTNSILMDSKFGVLAVSLGTSIVEEANKKAFDLAGSEDAIASVDLLTAPESLGPAFGEFYPDFNDFDDFNGFQDTITNLPSAEFRISCKVYYIEPNNPDVKVNYRTWHKKIDVAITSPNIGSNERRDTVKLSSVFSYWYFR
ncbi:MAG: hypothetical protein A2330_05645 [Ignavibacteria bacterium RIFOXYB2_FULL_36_7]|nr:MAG: hypothetical protein A2330_05645 [Ignavibacteria bacterium RIFOXYB2_FULL_36_7]